LSGDRYLAAERTSWDGNTALVGSKGGFGIGNGGNVCSVGGKGDFAVGSAEKQKISAISFFLSSFLPWGVIYMDRYGLLVKSTGEALGHLDGLDTGARSEDNLVSIPPTVEGTTSREAKAYKPATGLQSPTKGPFLMAKAAPWKLGSEKRVVYCVFLNCQVSSSFIPIYISTLLKLEI
jgi:hypothetical protein